MDTRERHEAIDYSHLGLHIAGVLLVIAVWVFVIYLIVAPLKAVPFDSDGVRCFSRALMTTCIQTAPQH